MDPLRRFIHEIHRRSLWQVLGIYTLASWVVLQVVGELTDATSLPEWFPTLAVGLLLVGLPIVLATAFVQEGAPGAQPQDAAEASSADPTPVRSEVFTWRNALGGGVVAFALLGVFGLGWVLLGGGVPGAPPSELERSVAVIPFVNMSGDEENEYFSDGITEELLNQIARIPDLRVPARTSSFAFKGQAVPVREIAAALDVAYILEGSVRRVGDQVLVTAQLVDAEADSHIWSETYERRLLDVFGIQREIARQVANQLSLELGSASTLLAEAAPTGSQAAHDLYLRGRYELNQRNIREAIDHFEEAIVEDPEYATAYGGLALAGVLASSYGVFEQGLVDRALEAADRALALDSTLSEPHTARGNVPTRIGGLRASERELRTALRLDPNDANAHQFLGRALMGLGRTEEALASATRAILLDPANAAHHWTRGMFHFTRANHVEAEADLREALRREPGNSYASGLLGATLVAAGRLDDAEGIVSPDVLRLARLAEDPATRDDALEELRSPPPGLAILGALEMAMRYDRRDIAMELAERYFRGATATNRGFVTYMLAHAAYLEPLKADPRFQEILRNMGIEPA
jgi:adenylate cyclase